MTVYTLAGIASSAVVVVELVSADGVSIQRVPVRDGVYADRCRTASSPSHRKTLPASRSRDADSERTHYRSFS
jgi:hypothetical protein